jgi:ABC-type antimicrobial peptide transport system ATPase subunit
MEQINHTQVINKIVEAEKNAQLLAEETKEKISLLPAEIEAEKEKMHAAYLSRANKRIEMIKSVENEAADEAIAELDNKLKTDLANVEKIFEQNRSVWVDKLFSMVTGI